MNKANYKTNPIPAMKTVDKPAAALNPAMLSAMVPVQPTPLAAVIEVPVMEGCKAVKVGSGTDFAFQKIFDVNGHNYLFTSGCCEDCIKIKHKKMLRAYLISHGATPGLRLWWKVWRETR